MENVPAGTAMTVTLVDSIGTDVNKEGDLFTGNLAEPIIVNGKVLAEKGATVRGTGKTSKNLDALRPGKT